MKDPTGTMRTLFNRLYMVICAVFVCIVAYSATYGAFWDDTQDVSASGGTVEGTTPSVDECRLQLSEHERNLHALAGHIFSIRKTKLKSEQWGARLPAWQKQVSAWSKACLVDSARSRSALKKSRKQLFRAVFGYDTALKRYTEIAARPLKQCQADTPAGVDAPQ